MEVTCFCDKLVNLELAIFYKITFSLYWLLSFSKSRIFSCNSSIFSSVSTSRIFFPVSDESVLIFLKRALACRRAAPAIQSSVGALIEQKLYGRQFVKHIFTLNTLLQMRIFHYDAKRK